MTSGSADESIGQTEQALSMPSHAVVGYWHNFKNGSGCPVRLTSVPSYWDVVIVAFANSDPLSPGRVVFSPYSSTAEGCTPLDVAQFKADIGTLKGQGKNVVLSLGGAEGAISMASSAQQSAFISSLEGILSTYKFSGVDVDLESGSGFTHGSAIQSLLPSALKTIHSWYATASGLGGDMFLSMAPEHPYVQGGVVAYSGIWGAYLPMINACRNELDLLHVQLYNNSSVPTPNVAPYNGQTFPVDSVDNLTASVKMLIEGFQPASPGPFFNGLPASKVAFGVPSGPSSSNPPFIGTTTIKNSYSCVTSNSSCGSLHMNANQSGFRGVMSWSINWDMYDKARNTAGRVDFQSIKTFMSGGTCTPTTSCSAMGAECGTIFNGCSNVSCGTCGSGETCSSNQCVTSTPTGDKTEGGTASGTGSACSSGEDATKAYDNLMTSSSFSKWCVSSQPNTTTPVSTMYDFSGTTAHAINKYTITSGNDAATRDPKDWKFQGCQGTCSVGSDTGWVTLDTRTGQFSGAARYQTNTYTFTNTTAYQQYRLRITANYGDIRVQLGEVQMFAGATGGTTDRTEGGTVSASNSGTSPEDMSKAFDNATNTKWFVGGNATPWIRYDFSGSTAYTITSYSVASANDSSDRDPKSWVLQGSNDGSSWTTVDTRTNEAFASRLQTKTYTVSSPGSYQHYKFAVTANNGSVDFQMSELQLFGN